MADKQPVATPQGVVYKWTKGGTEFQLFPEPYFSGADVKIYFGDVWVDDILGLTFVLQEQVKPIYSYASRTYKEVARGNRIVTGRFYVAFREAGYISSIFDHIGQFAYKDVSNDLIAAMSDQSRQPWHGQAQETWEQVVNEYWTKNTPDPMAAGDDTQGEVERRIAYYEKEIWGRTASADINHENQPYFYVSRRDERFQTEALQKTGFDIYLTYGPMEQAISANRNAKTVSFNTTVKAIRQVQLVSSSQDILGDGTVVEVYDFLAKDLD